MLLCGAALFVVSALVFTAVESTIHVEEGLGFHGLHCLLGPVHRNALPLLGGLALVAAALIEAVRHAIAFGRRVVAADPRRRRVRRAPGIDASRHRRRRLALPSARSSRPAAAAPPALSYR